ncbi:MAG: helix-turn-helix domain-containing protein [Clostridia bacterium]|nr:helix-turn-helix domain-containing protein [Clostridia bacterium]
MTFGEKLRQRRQQLGLTQRQTAGDRITRNMLSQLENDLAKPSVATLEYLAQVLQVSPSWLLDGKPAGEETELAKARTLLAQRKFEMCLEVLDRMEEPGDEAMLIDSMASLFSAEQALGDERFADALALAGRAISQSEKTLYRSPELCVRASAVIARCRTEAKQDAQQAVDAYKETYLQAQNNVRYHLVLARYALEQEHIQAAEREIWSIADLPDEERAEYLILRGRIAARKEEYENARLYLQQAEADELPKILRRELYHCMEICSRETGDYRSAYEYAAKQLAL